MAFRSGRGGYHPYVVDPGTISCNSQTEATTELEIATKAGQEYYVKEEVGWGFLIGRPHLYPMDQGIGQSEIEACHLQ